MLEPARERLRVDRHDGGDERLLVTDDEALTHQPVRTHAILQDGGCHVLAGRGDDEFLLASGDPHVAVVVDLTDVTGVHPAVCI